MVTGDRLASTPVSSAPLGQLRTKRERPALGWALFVTGVLVTGAVIDGVPVAEGSQTLSM
jgi:hypothetical protein